MVGKSALTSGEYVGFIPAINTQEEEVNIEAWIEDQPKTGAPAMRRGLGRDTGRDLGIFANQRWQICARMQKLHKAEKQSIFYPDPPQGPIWGGVPHAPHHRNAPSITSYGSPVDSWVIHCSSDWSRKNRTEIAKQVAQVAIKAFLRLLGLSSAPLRLLVSEAVS